MSARGTLTNGQQVDHAGGLSSLDCNRPCPPPTVAGHTLLQVMAVSLAYGAAEGASGEERWGWPPPQEGGGCPVAAAAILTARPWSGVLRE